MAKIRPLIVVIALTTPACTAHRNSEMPANIPRLPDVREELLRMVTEDQQARHALIERKDDRLWQHVEQIDQRNTTRLKTIVERYGWPGRSLVGEDGAHAAWLLVQHANAYPNFQKECLEKMKQSVKDGEASAMDLAYLMDRVAVAENRKQIYGTQFTYTGKCENMKPLPIEDEQHVDERRKSVGLKALAEHQKDMRQQYCASQGIINF
jgi:hypothetical protein